MPAVWMEAIDWTRHYTLFPARTALYLWGHRPSRIVSEALVAPRDEVRLVTNDGTVHEFRVVAVDVAGGELIGKRDRVPIENIATLEKRELSWIKTGILIGGLVLGIFGTECEDECNEYGGFMCC